MTISHRKKICSDQMPNRTSYFEAVNNEVLRTISSVPETFAQNSEKDSCSINDCKWLLPGEDIKNEEENVCLSSYSGKHFGKVYVTNYRLRFVDSSKAKNNNSFDITLGSISKVEKIGFSSVSRGGDSYGIDILCKDMRNVRFLYRRESHSRRPMYDCLQKFAFPNTNKLPFFATLYRQTFSRDGWSLFNTEREFKRQKIPKSVWSMTKINANYEMASTYPAVLAVPTEALTPKNGAKDLLQAVMKYRSKHRIPVLSWVDYRTCAAIVRSAQPLLGVTARKSSHDEEYLECIIRANPNSSQLIILDARPAVNAKANRAKGGGYETAYAHCDLTFLDIQNIHVVRDSLRRLKEACFPRIDYKHFYRLLDETKWLAHIQTILDGALRIVVEVARNRNSVLVHCSDGWDRTAQLTSLAMLQLDPYYRTIEGFAVLVEKEWCSFGHKFAHRIGHGEDKHSDGERSPIFVQFIDCVWQLFNQFTSLFEFNVKFLKTILDELYACRFGTFLYNSEKERNDLQVKKKTVSLWSYILEDRQQFENSSYNGEANADEFLSAVDTTLCTKLWTEYYCRYNSEVVLPEQDGITANEAVDGDDVEHRRERTPSRYSDECRASNLYAYEYENENRISESEIRRSSEQFHHQAGDGPLITPIRERIRLRRDEFLADLQPHCSDYHHYQQRSAEETREFRSNHHHYANTAGHQPDGAPNNAYYVTVVEQQGQQRTPVQLYSPRGSVDADRVMRIPRAKYYEHDAPLTNASILPYGEADQITKLRM